MRILAVFIGFFLILGLRSATAYFDTGNTLYTSCTSSNLFEQGNCMGTIVGHYDQMMSLGYSCGNDTTKNKQQLKDVVVKYLRDNPALRSEQAASLSFLAFFMAFDCTFPKPEAASTK